MPAAPEPRVDAVRLGRRRASRPDLEALARQGRQLATELLPSLDRPRAGLPEARRRARAMATAAHNYQRNRRLERAGREDFWPLYFIWTLLRTCNFRCGYCDDHRGRRYPDLPNDGVLDTAQALSLLRVMRTGTPSVYFAGGEPTLRRDLPTLTRAARDLDYHPILINTNGSAIDRLLRLPLWRTWLADTDVVIVSLDALDLDELERMWGYRRPEDVLRNLFLLRSLAGPMRVKLMVNTVIQPGRIGHAREVLDLTERLGIWFCPVPMNVGPGVSRTLLGDPDYLAFVRHVLGRKAAGARITGSLRMNRRLLFSEHLDCRNTLKPHVDFDGRLMWPCKGSVNVEPEPIDVLAFDDLRSLWSHAVTRIDPTGFHGPGPSQCGSDCNWAQNYTTDAYVHGLRHPLSLLGEVAEMLHR